MKTFLLICLVVASVVCMGAVRTWKVCEGAVRRYSGEERMYVVSGWTRAGGVVCRHRVVVVVPERGLPFGYCERF